MNWSSGNRRDGLMFLTMTREQRFNTGTKLSFVSTHNTTRTDDQLKQFWWFGIFGHYSQAQSIVRIFTLPPIPSPCTNVIFHVFNRMAQKDVDYLTQLYKSEVTGNIYFSSPIFFSSEGKVKGSRELSKQTRSWTLGQGEGGEGQKDPSS